MTYAQHDPDLQAAAERAAFRLSPEAWAACRRDYEDGVPVIVLAERYAVNDRTIRRRSADEGWERRDRRARAVITALENGRAMPDLVATRPSDDVLEVLVDATRDENMALLMAPDADGLARYAFRRAAEEATRGAPQQTYAWLRVVHAIDRSAVRLLSQGVPHRRGGDALRAELIRDVEHEMWRLRTQGGEDDDDAGEETAEA